MLIIDKRPTNKAEDLSKAAKPLEADGIKVISVTVGDHVQPEDLQPITSNPRDILPAEKSKDPKTLGETIMENVLQGIAY